MQWFGALLAAGLSLVVLMAGPAHAADSSTAMYCSQAEVYAQHHRKDAALFSAVPQNRDPARDRWHRVASMVDLQSDIRNANSTALVTMRAAHVIFVQASFQNQFGDSVERVDYCYRPDRSLAHLHSELKSFHGGMRVTREMTFDDSGKTIASAMQSSDLDSGKPRPLPPDFWDFPPPVFLRVTDLPFAKLP